MTIEFSCEHCGKALSTGDDKAGRRAKCPDCGESIAVPTINTDGIDLMLSVPPVPDFDRSTHGAKASAASGSSGRGTSNCPMCGFATSAQDDYCPACGEPLKGAAAKRLRSNPDDGLPLDLGAAMSRAWAIYKRQLGLVLGTQLVGGTLSFAAMLPGFAFFMAIVISMEHARDDDLPLLIGLGVAGAACFLVGWVAAVWLSVGMSITLLKMTRGESVTLSDIFTGRPFLGRAFLCGFLFTIMGWIGQQMCVLPYFLVLIFFWPYLFVLIDDDAPNIQALLNSPKVTSKSIVATIGLILVSGAIGLLGGLALLVGLIFAIPFVNLLWCVAYDEMRGGELVESSVAADTEGLASI